jgi:multidrug efflux pump
MLVSGMIIGTIFTLFVVPSIYMLVAKTHTAYREEAEEKINLVGEPVGAGV